MPALLLFVFGLALRLLFAHATPDGGPGWHAGFQGDAPVWQRLAAAHATGADDLEWRLPIRPPAMQHLIAWLWNGDAATVGPTRFLFAVLGAAVAPLLWLLLRRYTAPNVALVAAALCAASSNLLLLGSGLHSETPFLVLVLLLLLLQPALAARGTALRATGIALLVGALHGATCLLRAEHALTVVALLALARHAGASWRTLLTAVLAATVVVVPWQLHANRLVDAYNTEAPPLQPMPVGWDAPALAALRALPAFAQTATRGFVSDTVRARGGTTVRAADLEILREAYGAWPEPVPRAFISIHGALNFFLANSREADGAFSSMALDRPPPLTGGDERYPRGLRGVLPRGGTLALDYPPHLDAFVHGTSKGLAELAADPLDGARRIGRKLWHAVEGATGGVGGYALPIGLSGQRRSVDLVTATGAWANVWRALVLGVAALGLWRLRSVRGLWPLLVYAATRVVVVAVFFGYARHGALCLPVVALGVAAVVAPWLRNPRWLLLAGVVLLLVEAVRCTGTDVRVGGREPSAWPLQDFAPRPVVFD